MNEKKIKMKNGYEKHFFTMRHNTFKKPFLCLSLSFCHLAIPQPNYDLTPQYRQFSATSSYSQYIFHETSYVKAPFTQTITYFLSSAIKNLSLLSRKKQNKTLMKPDAFDFNSVPAFLQQLYPFHPLITSPYMLLNRKTLKNSLCLKKFVKIK